MTDHVKRGMKIHTDRSVTTEWDGMDDGNVNAVVRCTECGEKIEMRYRRGMDAYVELGCPCGARSLDLRIGGVVGLDIDEWDADTDVDY